MFNRDIRSRFDLIRENYFQQNNIKRQERNYSGKKNELFGITDKVWVKDYRNMNKSCWVKAEVVECLGSRNYICKVLEENLLWKRHLDQIRKAKDMYESESEIYVGSHNNDKKIVKSDFIVSNNSNVVEKEISKASDCREQKRNDQTESFAIENENANNKSILEERESVESTCIIDSNITGIGKEQNYSQIVEVEIPQNKNKIENNAIAWNVNERPKRSIKKVERLNL